MNDQSAHQGQTLADLIGSRLCHDLVNPLGAIGNGVELLEMSGGAAASGPEMDLIRDAVRDAQARLRFFRIAFGAAGAQQIVSAREAREIAEAPYRATRLTPDWTIAADLPRSQVKLAYLMMLCAETALPLGGDMRVAQDGAGRWRIEVGASKLRHDEALWNVLRFGIGAAGRPLRPAEVQFAALHALGEELDVTVNYVAREDGLTMATA
jgi:histidine phosphotransferase ChpT